MSQFLYNVLKISGGANDPNASPGCAPVPDRNSQLLHRTGNSALVLLTGKATLLPTLFFALHNQDSASGCFKQQFVKPAFSFRGALRFDRR